MQPIGCGATRERALATLLFRCAHACPSIRLSLSQLSMSSSSLHQPVRRTHAPRMMRGTALVRHSAVLV